MCRLRQLRRGRGGGGAVPFVLSGRHHPQSERRGLAAGGDARGCDRFPAAPPRQAPHRFGLMVGSRMSQMISPSRLDAARPISIAVLAIGGQGGGVLVDWIVALAESQDWIAQS